MIRCGKVRKTGIRYVCRPRTLGLVFGAALLSASGCSMPADLEETEEVVVRIEKSDKEESIYTLTEAAVTDVEKTASKRFDYVQARSEDVLFPISGRRVAEVYVNLGDRVEEGQLLALLDGEDHDAAIYELEYQIARSKIQLSYLDENEEYEKSMRWWRFVYQSSQTEDESEKLESDLADIEQKYRYRREDYQDTIEMAQMRLEIYQREMMEGRIYAGMSGVISRLGGNMETIVSDVNKPAFTIIDDSNCLFESDTAYAEYFAEGEIYELVSGRGDSANIYRVRPWNKAAWKDRSCLEFVDGADAESIEVGTFAYLTLMLEKRENVIAVNNSALHTADGKVYVYVLGENDIREVRWVETGLCGDRMTEIVSGLEEGEAVILK